MLTTARVHKICWRFCYPLIHEKYKELVVVFNKSFILPDTFQEKIQTIRNGDFFELFNPIRTKEFLRTISAWGFLRFKFPHKSFTACWKWFGWINHFIIARLRFDFVAPEFQESKNMFDTWKVYNIWITTGKSLTFWIPWWNYHNILIRCMIHWFDEHQRYKLCS